MNFYNDPLLNSEYQTYDILTCEINHDYNVAYTYLQVFVPIEWWLSEVFFIVQ